jgi:filamentous hemagglutinin family protein
MSIEGQGESDTLISRYSIWSCWEPILFATAYLIGMLFLVGLFLCPINIAHGQDLSPITSTTGAGNLATIVTQNGNTYNITGGHRPGGGVNLFHSFGDFGVPANNIANFLNETGLPTSNILGHVTGGNISNIFGTIQTTDFGNANLFLMNPAGFLFGPNATVNVGGMVAFTSAEYLRFQGTDTLFNNTSNPESLSLLSFAPVAAFGFLGSNPAAIAIQGSTLQVAQGQSLSFVGGNQGFTAMDPDTGNPVSVPGGVTMTGATLSASGGQVNVASVASPGEVSAVDFMPTSGMMMGNITLSQGATLDVSGDAAGTIRIRGSQFVIADATLSANTDNTIGAPLAIDINVSGDLSIMDTRATAAITATTSGTGDAGAVKIVAANIEASTSSQESFTLIDTHTSDDGRGGNVNIMTYPDSATGNLFVSGTVTTGFRFIDSGTAGTGTGGDVTVDAKNIDLELTAITTGDFVARQDFIEPSGSAGNLTIAAESLEGRNFLLSTEAYAALADTQQAGNITITGRQNIPATIDLLNVQATAGGSMRGGDITITNFDNLITDFGFFETFTVFGQGGGITVDGRAIDLTNGSKLVATTFGDGDAGDISLTATDHVSLLGQTPANPNPLSVFSPTGLFSNSFGDFGLGNLGASGSIEVTTPTLTMNTGGRINTITNSSGRGGNVIIDADKVSISGEFAAPSYVIEGSIVDIGDFRPSGIFTRTIGANESCMGSCGSGGNIIMTVGSLTMGPGSRLDAGTSSTGDGGNVTVNARETLSMSGTLIDGSPVGIFSSTIGTESGSGQSGDITATARQSITISNGASVSASSTGPGNTGNIQIDAGNQFTMTNSSVTTEANQASGGAIKITTDPGGTVQLTNSTISASVLDGTGGGGSVNIDPQFVILLNSNILANAVQGPGGNISITTNFLLPDANSTISASSQFGTNGTVTIQSPNAPVSGQIQPLGKTPLIATSLLNQHCAALAGGQFSSFTVAGRNSLPTEPGSWLTSPLAMLGTGAGEGLSGLSSLSGLSRLSGVVRAGLAAHQIDQIDKTDQTDQPLLSLRQIAPAGFLTQAFAVDRSAGCRS